MESRETTDKNSKSRSHQHDTDDRARDNQLNTASLMLQLVFTSNKNLPKR